MFHNHGPYNIDTVRRRAVPARRHLLSRKNSRLPYDDDFLDANRRYYVSDWRADLVSACGYRQVTWASSSNAKQQSASDEASPQSLEGETGAERKRCLDDMPDEVLLRVFGHFFPDELLQTLRRVCKRWSHVITTGALSYLRLPLIDEEAAPLAASLLQKVSAPLRRICLRSAVDLENVLPDEMPLLQLFELHFTEHVMKKVLSIDFLRSLDKRAPRLRCLCLIKDWMTQDKTSFDLTSFEGLFPNLRCICIKVGSCSLLGIKSFLEGRPELEDVSLRTANIILENGGLFSGECANPSVQRFALKYIRSGAVDVACLRNVVFLDLESYSCVPHEPLEPAVVENLLALRSFSQLKHLHISYKLIREHVDELFAWAPYERQFPHSLEYLKIHAEYIAPAFEHVALIAVSCPNLRSVNIGGRTARDLPQENAVVRCLALHLSNVRFVNVDKLGSFKELLDSPQIDEAFPELHCVVVRRNFDEASFGWANRRHEDQKAAFDSLLPRMFTRWPKLIVWMKEEFIAYERVNGQNGPQIDVGSLLVSKTTTQNDEAIHELLKLEEGYCCVNEIDLI